MTTNWNICINSKYQPMLFLTSKVQRFLKEDYTLIIQSGNKVNLDSMEQKSDDIIDVNYWGFSKLSTSFSETVKSSVNTF